MLRTMWFALSCLVVLGAVIAIKIAATPAPATVAAAHDQTAEAFGPNSAAKSDRLYIPARVQPMETDPVPSRVTTIPVETPPRPPETNKKAINEPPRKTADTTTKQIAHRRWQDSNAKLIDEPPPRRTAKAKPEKTSADNDQSKTTSHVFQCRKDAFGSLLRSMDLSPHCSS